MLDVSTGRKGKKEMLELLKLARTNTIGYANLRGDEELWNIIFTYELPNITIINTQNVIDNLEYKAETHRLSMKEEELLELCKEGREKGADDLSVY